MTVVSVMAPVCGYFSWARSIALSSDGITSFWNRTMQSLPMTRPPPCFSTGSESAAMRATFASRYVFAQPTKASAAETASATALIPSSRAELPAGPKRILPRDGARVEARSRSSHCDTILELIKAERVEYKTLTG